MFFNLIFLEKQYKRCTFAVLKQEKVMKQEEKDLLLKYLSMTLPYGVICKIHYTFNNETTFGEEVIANEDDNIRCIDIHTKEIQADYYGEWVDLEHCKPYLRSMSSMTEEEKEEYKKLRWTKLEHYTVFWLLKNHFDFMDLIPKGLALETPEGMYN